MPNKQRAEAYSRCSLVLLSNMPAFTVVKALLCKYLGSPRRAVKELYIFVAVASSTLLPLCSSVPY